MKTTEISRLVHLRKMVKNAKPIEITALYNKYSSTNPRKMRRRWHTGKDTILRVQSIFIFVNIDEYCAFFNILGMSWYQEHAISFYTLLQ